MNVVFHVLAGAAIAHVAATRLKPGLPVAAASRRLCGPDAAVLSCVAGVSVLSHGVLDGLKHGYPLSAAADIAAAAAVAVAWCLAVQPRFVALFATALIAAVVPDVVDLGPGMLRSVAATWAVPALPSWAVSWHLFPWHLFPWHLFPWHWADGSGSMFPAASRAPAATKILDTGDNLAVSWANHLIVVALAMSGICANLSVFRVFSGPAPPVRGSSDASAAPTLHSRVEPRRPATAPPSSG